MKVRKFLVDWGRFADNGGVAVRSLDTVQAIIADGVVTEAEADQLVGTRDAAVLEPLFDALETERVRLAPGAVTRVTTTLQLNGYVVPDVRTTSTRRIEQPLPVMGSPDATFENLARITGNTSQKLLIGVADAPMDFRHPLIARNAWNNPADVPNGYDDDGDGRTDDVHGWDFESNAALASDTADGHGTATTSLAVWGTDRLLAVGAAVIDRTRYEPLWQGINYAIAKGARVINMSISLQTDEARQRFSQVVAANPRVLFVLAAGNDSADIASSSVRAAMTRHTNLVVVGGSDAHGGVWEGSRSGSAAGDRYVTLAARADNVTAAGPYADVAARRVLAYSDNSGTSFAAPQVANAAGKMMLLCPILTASDVWRILCATADDSDAWAGLSRTGGTLNAKRAMSVAAVYELTKRGWLLDDAIARVADTNGEARAIRRAIENVQATTAK